MPRLGIDDLHAGDLGGAQRLLREGDGVLVERDDVDLLAPQFADDRLHAHALHPHAGADRIHVLVAALHGDLGPLAGFPGRRADLYGAIVDFRDFHLEQPLHQHGIGARHDHLGAFRRALNRADHDAQPVAQVVGFQSRLLALGQARLGATQVHDHVRAFDALHDAVHQLAHPAVKLVEDGVALGLAHLLHDHLFGRLRSDPA